MRHVMDKTVYHRLCNMLIKLYCEDAINKMIHYHLYDLVNNSVL